MRDVRVCLLAALTVACAFRAYLFFQTDEHLSVVEFTALKMRWSQAQEMSEDYTKEIRPWLQPALYLAVAKVAELCHVDSRFLSVALFRLSTGALAIVSFVGLSHWWRRSEKAATEAAPAFTSPYLLPFLPYLFTRTSAETLSGTFLAFAWLAYFPSGFGESALRAPAKAVHGLAAGLLLGLAFDTRPQTALFAVGLGVWTLLRDQRSLAWWASLVAGGGAALVLLLLVDRWGYGHWVISPYRYWVVNIVEGMAASFGTQPFFAYVYLLLPNPYALIAAYCLIVVVVAVVRNGLHPLSWSLLAFVLTHSAISHKEDRFLFPMVPFLALLIPMAFAPASARASRWLTALRRFGHAGYMTGAFATVVMLFVAYGNCNTGLARELERWGRRDVPVIVVESLDRLIARQPAYERSPWVTVRTPDPIPHDLAHVPLAYVVAYDILLAPGECPSPKLHGRCMRLWSEFPFDGAAHDPWLARAEGGQEWLRSNFAPGKPPHPSWYAVFEFVPE
jgi:hypothetical protein